jgi:hypothetical protein
MADEEQRDEELEQRRGAATYAYIKRYAPAFLRPGVQLTTEQEEMIRRLSGQRAVQIQRLDLFADMMDRLLREEGYQEDHGIVPHLLDASASLEERVEYMKALATFLQRLFTGDFAAILGHWASIAQGGVIDSESSQRLGRQAARMACIFLVVADTAGVLYEVD